MSPRNTCVGRGLPIRTPEVLYAACLAHRLVAWARASTSTSRSLMIGPPAHDQSLSWSRTFATTIGSCSRLRTRCPTGSSFGSTLQIPSTWPGRWNLQTVGRQSAQRQFRGPQGLPHRIYDQLPAGPASAEAANRENWPTGVGSPTHGNWGSCACDPNGVGHRAAIGNR